MTYWIILTVVGSFDINLEAIMLDLGVLISRPIFKDKCQKTNLF